MTFISGDSATKSEGTGEYEDCASRRKSFLMRLTFKVENVKHKIRRNNLHPSRSFDTSDYGSSQRSPDDSTVSTTSKSPDARTPSARSSRSTSPLSRTGNPSPGLRRFLFQSPIDDGSGMEHTEVQEQGGMLFSSFQKRCVEDFEDSRFALQLACACLTECELWSREQEALTRVSGSLSEFEGEKMPCSFEKYVLRILRYSESSPSCVIVGLILLLSLKKKQPEMQLTETNAQRFLLVAIMVANKFLDDEIYSNKMWAKIGELTLKELNKLELTFLCTIDMSCPVRRENYDDFVLMLTHTNPFLDDSADNLPPCHSHDSRRSTIPKDRLSLPLRGPKRSLPSSFHSGRNNGQASSCDLLTDPKPETKTPTANKSFDEIRKEIHSKPAKMTQFFRQASHRLGALLATG